MIAAISATLHKLNHIQNIVNYKLWKKVSWENEKCKCCQGYINNA